MTSRLARVGWGVGSAAIGQALTAFQTIGLLPLFLRAWGVHTYGRWCTLTAFMSYLALLDLGGQNYIANVLAIHAAERNWADFKIKLSQAVSFFLALGLVVFLLLSGLIFVGLHWSIPFVHRALQWEEAVAIGALVANSLLAIPGGVYATVYRSVGMYTRGAMIGNVFRIITIGLSVLLLMVKINLARYSLGMLAMGAALTSYIIFDTRRMIPETRGIIISPRKAREGLSHLGGGAWHFWLIVLSQAMNQQGVILVIAGLLTPEAVVIYTTHRTLASIPGFMSVFIQAPLLPELSTLWAKKEMEDLRRWALSAIQVVVLITTLGGLMVWVGAPLLYPLWTGRELRILPVLLAVLICQAIFAAGWTTSSWSMLAANSHRRLVRWWLANATVSVLLALALVPRYRLAGAAIGSLLGDIAFGLFLFPTLVANFLSVSTGVVYRHMFLPLLAAVPIILLGLLAKALLPGWWSIGSITVLLAMLLYPTTYLALGKPNMERIFKFARPRWLQLPR